MVRVVAGYETVSTTMSFEVKVSKKRLISLPKAIADKMGIREGMRLRMYIEGDRIVIEPVRDAFWYALHGPKIGYISFKELEEESEREQEKLQNST
jgi:AbrB family looped-hinge helix DNA binding protein